MAFTQEEGLAAMRGTEYKTRGVVRSSRATVEGVFQGLCICRCGEPTALWEISGGQIKISMTHGRHRQLPVLAAVSHVSPSCQIIVRSFNQCRNGYNSPKAVGGLWCEEGRGSGNCSAVCSRQEERAPDQIVPHPHPHPKVHIHIQNRHRHPYAHTVCTHSMPTPYCNHNHCHCHIRHALHIPRSTAPRTDIHRPKASPKTATPRNIMILRGLIAHSLACDLQELWLAMPGQQNSRAFRAADKGPRTGVGIEASGFLMLSHARDENQGGQIPDQLQCSVPECLSDEGTKESGGRRNGVEGIEEERKKRKGRVCWEVK